MYCLRNWQSKENYGRIRGVILFFMTEISQRDNISKPTFDTESKAHKESLNTKEP